MNATAVPPVTEHKALKVLGILSLVDALFYMPRGYEDFSVFHSRIASVPAHGKHNFALTVTAVDFLDRKGAPASLFPRKGQPRAFRARIKLRDSDGLSCSATVFGNVWEWKDIKTGDVVHLRGDYETRNGFPVINNPSLVPFYVRGRVVPLYPLKRGVTNEDVHDMMRAAILYKDKAALLACGNIGLDAKTVEARIGARIESVLHAVHFPETIVGGRKALDLARKMAVLQVLNQAEQLGWKVPCKHSVIPIGLDDMKKVATAIPFNLTSNQRAAIRSILDDLRSPFPMKRLLSGDVGTGKTVSFLAPAACAAMSGAKVAVLVPSLLLVSQIAHEARQMFPWLNVMEIVGSAKKNALQKLEGGTLVVGTTALLSRAGSDAFNFVVVDEQHKFSRVQREAMVGAGVNLLQASATPIPRTMALIANGGMDVSELRECPVSKNIMTSVVREEGKNGMLRKVREIVGSGGQVAVIYPLVTEKDIGTVQEESDLVGRPKIQKRNVEDAFERWSGLFPGRVGMLHGKLSDDEKLAAIRRMKAKEIDVLVTSTVIEVGVTLPDLKAVIVVNAERYGVAQLHQLRGRVARHGGDGWFFLYAPDPLDEEGQARLDLLVQHNDGYLLAEKDMELRGFGDLAADSDDQAGAAYTMFRGLKLMPSDLDGMIRNQQQAG